MRGHTVLAFCCIIICIPFSINLCGLATKLTHLRHQMGDPWQCQARGCSGKRRVASRCTSLLLPNRSHSDLGICRLCLHWLLYGDQNPGREGTARKMWSQGGIRAGVLARCVTQDKWSVDLIVNKSVKTKSAFGLGFMVLELGFLVFVFGLGALGCGL